MISDNEEFESYVPVYDTVPEKWEDSRPFIVEMFKRISNAVNAREIGFFIDEEVLSGKAFIPSGTLTGTSQQFRQVLRKVVDVSSLVPGANSFPHGITFDANFTLVDSWVSATNSTILQAVTMVYPQVLMDATLIHITSPIAFDRAYFICEFMQEL
jgi:hypothetical protein